MIKLVREIAEAEIKLSVLITRRAREIRRLRDEGKTLQDIADAFGITRQRTFQILAQEGK